MQRRYGAMGARMNPAPKLRQLELFADAPFGDQGVQ